MANIPPLKRYSGKVYLSKAATKRLRAMQAQRGNVALRKIAIEMFMPQKEENNGVDIGRETDETRNRARKESS